MLRKTSGYEYINKSFGEKLKIENRCYLKETLKITAHKFFETNTPLFAFFSITEGMGGGTNRTNLVKTSNSLPTQDNGRQHLMFAPP